MRIVCAQSEEAALGILGEWLAEMMWRELYGICTL